MKNLIVVVGPTAVGKTAIGICLAKHFRTEIISSDSRQMYREMCIGTAVPSVNELSEVKHHFIQNKSIADYYNASMFEGDVLEKLKILFETYDTVIMVGGSTLYIDAVCYGIDDLPTVDLTLRNEINKKFKEEGIEYLRRQLKQLDPKHYANVDLSNPNRITKAIEISLITGKPYSEHLTSTKKIRNFNIVKVGLNTPREILFNRINSRVDTMIADGLVDEVSSLINFRNENALKTVGYRELFDYLDGNISFELAIEQIKTNTRRYAKRQIAWFKRDNNLFWFNPLDDTDIVNYITSNLK